MNRAALFSMLCSEIGIHLDSASFSEILKRREVQIHLFPYFQVTPLVYALEEIIKGLLKANSPTELELPASLYSSTMSFYSSPLDCYFQHSPSTASTSQIISNGPGNTSPRSSMTQTSQQSRSSFSADFLTKEEEANQYFQNQIYRGNTQPMNEIVPSPEPYWDNSSPASYSRHKSHHHSNTKRSKQISINEGVAIGAAAVGVLGAIGAAAMVIMKSKNKK